LHPLLDPILLVDDEKDNLQALNRLLRGLFQVTTTTSPLEALQLMGAQRFHVIVSDQRMPDMSGVELLEKAKNRCRSINFIN
jgi:CheY-like chemotaxis protein